MRDIILVNLIIGVWYKMIVLNRESIINGLIELRNEEDLENINIIENIRKIINLDDISNIEKLKLINNELGKILSDDII